MDKELITWEAPHFYKDGTPFIPYIYECNGSCEKTEVPVGFNAVAIILDCSSHSNLNWSSELAKAQTYLEQGFLLFWHLDLGLFAKLSHPLDHEGQYGCLSLALDHFRDVIWSQWAQSTIGVSLYRGNIDVNLDHLLPAENLQNWLGNHLEDIKCFREKACHDLNKFDTLTLPALAKTDAGRFLTAIYYRNVIADYLSQLALQLPPEANAFILLSYSNEWTPLQKAILFQGECYKPLGIIVAKGPLHSAPTWAHGPISAGFIGSSLPEPSRSEFLSKVAICLPPQHSFPLGSYELLNHSMIKLTEGKTLFRFIDEEALIMNLEGLDEIIVCSNTLSPLGKRQLQGFSAAGGCVTYLEN